ncbi:MAG TPA: hypothetical protein VN764_11765, partial [Polyangiaceae bacterium]|nr:hypothetical protein [Polyangiaceae bacterium]
MIRYDAAQGVRRGRRVYLGARCLLVSSLALSCAKAPPSSAPYVVAADAKDAQSQVRHFKEQWELSTPLSRR